MHPAIMRQFAADHITQIYAEAEDVRLARRARRARRHAPSRLAATGTLGHDVGHLGAPVEEATASQAAELRCDVPV